MLKRIERRGQVYVKSTQQPLSTCPRAPVFDIAVLLPHFSPSPLNLLLRFYLFVFCFLLLSVRRTTNATATRLCCFLANSCSGANYLFLFPTSPTSLSDIFFFLSLLLLRCCIVRDFCGSCCLPHSLYIALVRKRHARGPPPELVRCLIIPIFPLLPQSSFFSISLSFFFCSIL